MAPLIAHPRRETLGSFEAVYRKHVRDVYGFSLSLLGNAEDAEDVTQTTFLNAYRAIQRGENVRNLRAWLLAIAHNVCRQRFRTAARRPQEVELDAEAAEAFVDEDAPSAEEIRNAMRQLAFNQRTVLVLREIEGLTYEEIAQAMGLSLSAVETLLFRARQALREQLEAAEQDLGCDAVQRLISLQLDGKLSRQDRGLLRAHLRTCAECARFARSQRARKRVMPSLIAVPLPMSLSGAFQAGGTGFVSSKVAALAVSAALVGTGALVETGVMPKPIKAGADTSASATVQPASSGSARVGALDELVHSPFSSLVLARADALEQATQERVAKPSGAKGAKGAKDGKDGKDAKNQPASDGASQPAANTPGGSGGSSSSGAGGSGGGGLGGIAGGVPTASPPPAPALGGGVGDVTGAIDEAQSNLPALPASPEVKPPSLPPVPVPGLGSLP